MATPPPDAAPAQPSDAARAATALITLYAWAEGSLIARLTAALRAQPATTAGAAVVMAAARRMVAQITAYLTLHTPPLVAQLIAAETAGGRAHAGAALAAIPGSHPGSRPGQRGAGAGGEPPTGGPRGLAGIPGGDPFDLSLDHGERAARAIEADLTSALEDVRRRITRLPDDVYKAVAPQAAIYQVVDNNRTAEQAQSMAWRVFTSQGITGFTDRSGRDWSLNAYVEMAVRTAAARAFRESAMQRMLAVGVRYFRVAEHVNPCPECFPWQHQVIADEPDVSGFPTLHDAVAAGLFHPNCFPGFVPVESPTGLRGADSRWYEGDLVVVHTASGDELSVTPNHPVLTPEGWVAAGLLEVGQRVIRYSGRVEPMVGSSPRDEQVPARIGDVVDALRHARGVTTARVPGAAEQFHGDGSDADVEVVLVDRLLEDRREPSGSERGSDRALFVGGVRFAPLLPSSAADEILMLPGTAADRVLRSSGELDSLGATHRAETALHGVAASVEPTLPQIAVHGADVDAELVRDLLARAPGRESAHDFIDAPLGFGGAAPSHECGSLNTADALSPQPYLDPTPADAEGGRDLLGSLAGQVSADDVIEVNRRHFAGHVYNLESGDGWYVASSIVVHNCRCTPIPWIPEVDELPAEQEWTEQDQARYAATQRQRALEREIRKAKQAAATALDADTRAQAEADVKTLQARMRQFLRQHDHLGRQYRREQPRLRMDRTKTRAWEPTGPPPNPIYPL